MIHRLQWGGTVHVVQPPALLEGGRLHGPSLSTDSHPHKYIPDSPDLDDEVQALHDLARSGTITADTAERQINMYLMVASHRELCLQLPPERRRWLLLPITDAPHPGLLPDLGQIIHRVLARDPLQSSLSTVVEQCIPCMRHVSRAPRYLDSQEVLLNLVLALLIGCFPGTLKKPAFGARAILWRRVHILLTKTREEQTAFLEGHQDILVLACMEYMARVLPLHMPAQDAILTGKDSPSSGFYRRIPPLCDEFRQFLDETVQGARPSWEDMQGLCAGYVERVSRLKRSHPGQQQHARDGPKEPAPRLPVPNILEHWEAPQLMGDPTRNEFRLLGLSLGLHGSIVMQIQRDLQISVLPGNLRRLQIERLLEQSGGEMRTAFLRTRRYVCMHCMLAHKTQPTPRLRLDTLQQVLVCATCMRPDLMQINLLGRVMRFRQQHFYLCPVCVSIQQYHGRDEQPWLSTPPAGGAPCTCPHVQGTTIPAASRRKRACFICSETAVGHVIERVDHLTGVIHSFHYCQRHTPRPEVLYKCVNARQLGAFDPVWRRPASGHV